MQRKRTTIQDYRRATCTPATWRRSSAAARWTRSTATASRCSCSPRSSPTALAETIQILLNFLHEHHAFSIKRHGPRITLSPWSTARSLRLAHRRIRFLQPEELEALCAPCRTTTSARWNGPIYVAAAMTGLRTASSSVCAGHRRHWSASRASASRRASPRRIDSPKSHRGRSVPMPTASPRSSSIISSARAGAATRTWCSPIRWRRAARPRRLQTAQALHAGPRTRRRSTSSRSTSCATRRDANGRRRGAACARSRNGWATRTRGRPDLSRSAPDPTAGAAFAQRAFGGLAERARAATRGESRMDLRINRLFYDTGKASYPCAMKRSATSRRLARFRPTSSERRAEQWPRTPRFVDEQHHLTCAPARRPLQASRERRRRRPIHAGGCRVTGVGRPTRLRRCSHGAQLCCV